MSSKCKAKAMRGSGRQTVNREKGSKNVCLVVVLIFSFSTARSRNRAARAGPYLPVLMTPTHTREEPYGAQEKPTDTEVMRTHFRHPPYHLARDIRCGRDTPRHAVAIDPRDS
jgi:hypothetical protein